MISCDNEKKTDELKFYSVKNSSNSKSEKVDLEPDTLKNYKQYLVKRFCDGQDQKIVQKYYDRLEDKTKAINTMFFAKLIIIGVDKREELLCNIPTEYGEFSELFSFVTLDYRKNTNKIYNNMIPMWGEALKDSSIYDKIKLENFLNFSKALNETTVSEFTEHVHSLFEKHPQDYIDIMYNRKDLKDKLMLFLENWKNYYNDNVFEIAKKNKNLFLAEDRKQLKLD